MGIVKTNEIDVEDNADATSAISAGDERTSDAASTNPPSKANQTVAFSKRTILILSVVAGVTLFALILGLAVGIPVSKKNQNSADASRSASLPKPPVSAPSPVYVPPPAPSPVYVPPPAPSPVYVPPPTPSPVYTPQPVSAPTAAAGSICNAAVTVYTGSTVSGSTYSAINSLNGGSYDACSITTDEKFVWYQFLGTGTTVTASTCGYSNFDTRLHVFSGSCSLVSCVIEDDDSCIGNNGAIVSWFANVGSYYYILVGGYNGGTGSFQLEIS